jgi:hypothetical protein
MSDFDHLCAKRPIDTTLAARTAEALALPLMVCRHRNCRRGQRCRWHFKSTGEPCCLERLTAAQRAIFNQIYRAADYTKKYLATDSEDFEATTGIMRVLDETAIAIARNDRLAYRRDQWDAARRERAGRMRKADAERQKAAEETASAGRPSEEKPR